MPDRIVLLLDGGFVTKALRTRSGRPATASDVVELTRTILAKTPVEGMSFLRTYYYDAEPYEGVATNPIDGSTLDLGSSRIARTSKALLAELDLQPHFAVRRGSLVMSGWKLGQQASRSLELKAAVRAILEARDVVPDVKQKGVDLKIGLDIAWISLKRLADCIVLVTADSDFVPAMKFARREGLKVYLDVLGHSHVSRELRIHADLVL